MAWVIHVFERASTPEDDAFVTEAIAGPFSSRDDAQRALTTAGWRADGPTQWESPRRRNVSAQLAQTTDLPPA